VKVGDLVNWTAVPPMDLQRHLWKDQMCIIVEKYAFGVKVRSVLTAQLFATAENCLKVVSEGR
jgi:hypothetical protein